MLQLGTFSSQRKTCRKEITQTQVHLSDASDDRMAFSKTWTGSTCSPDDFDDRSELFIDADCDEDDKSPWASDANSFDLSFSFEDCGHQAQVEQVIAADLLPSKGSELHASGGCKPCTWFWKASGCQNGRECMHCHLCPKSASKLRKKDNLRAKKAAACSSDQAEEPSIWQQPHVDAMPQLVQQWSVPFRPPPGLPHPPPPVSKFIAPLGLGFPSGEPDVKQRVLHSDDESTADGLSQQADQCGISDSGELDAPSVPASEDLCSVGSRLHAAGECKPCSWFWKPQGCKNGKDCLHCHVCPDGEVRRKKKQKAVEIRKLNSMMPADAKSTSIGQDANEDANSLHLQTLMVQQQLLIQQQQHQLLQMQLQMGMQQQQMQLARLPVL